MATNLDNLKIRDMKLGEFFESFAGPAAFLLWDGSRAQVMQLNKEYVVELGLGAEATENIDLLSTLVEEDQQQYKGALMRALESKKEEVCETRRQSFSQLCGSSFVYVRTRLRLLEKTAEGDVFFASVRNITQEKLQIDSVVDSDRRFRFAAEQANVYAWEYTIDTKEMRPCYRCMRDLGLPALLENYPEPAIEMGIFPQDYADMYRDWHHQLEQGAKKLESIIPLTPERVPFHVRYTTVFSGAGEPIKAYGSATQVVDSAREKQYQEIISSLGKAYFCLYYIDLASGEFRQLKKSDLSFVEEIIGEQGEMSRAFKQMSKYLVVPEQAEEVLKFADLSDLSQRLKDRDTIGIHFNGPHVGWCEGLFVAVKRDSYGQCTHVIWGVRSIQQEREKDERQKLELSAALKQMEEALEEAKRANAARTTFLSRMSHDIRTPLNGIIGLMEIDERHAEDVELLRENRAKARVAANHLLALISDVLDLSKMDDKNVQLAEEVFDISKVAGEVGTISSMRAAENGITLYAKDLTVFDIQPYVYGSPLHVKQLLLNIIGNAIKYNRPGGSVTCTASMKMEDEQTVRYNLSIADTGIGMSKEFLQHLYEPFSQEQNDARSVYQGTGLGMAIVKSLLDKMNGTIEVESELGKGTTFLVSIPFRIAREEDLPGNEEKKVAKVSGARVLLVEDNLLNMEIASTLLKEADVEITQAYNGQQAIEIYGAAAPGSFDLILMDLMMPVMDGFTATKEIRAMAPEYRDIPIIAMTANAFAEDVQECLDKGMNGHLAKPLELPKLFALIAEYRQKNLK